MKGFLILTKEESILSSFMAIQLQGKPKSKRELKRYSLVNSTSNKLVLTSVLINEIDMIDSDITKLLSLLSKKEDMQHCLEKSMMLSNSLKVKVESFSSRVSTLLACLG